MGHAIMQVLFVHGMGRSPLSGWPMLRRFRQHGIRTQSFSYCVSRQSFASIQSRLEKRIEAIASDGEYILIGHSLGGVLLRAALANMDDSVKAPKQLFLLGSPVKKSRLAVYFRRYWMFRFLTQDCGELLASSERMLDIPASDCSATAVVGVKGINGKSSPFRDELNDGVVSLSEVSADWIQEQIQLPVIHSFLPSSKRVSSVILSRIV